jgi:xylan 1,4-beta-xylosidase
VAAWNIVDPGMHGATRTVELSFSGVAPDASVTIERVDDNHGNVLPKYVAMGSPVDPTPAEIEKLNRETALGAAEQTHLTEGRLKLELMPNALVMVKVEGGH